LPAVILLEQDSELKLLAAWPPEDSLDTASESAARWAFDRSEPAGRNTATLPLIPWFFVPLQVSRGNLGVVGVALKKDHGMDSEMSALFDTLVEQTAAAVDRALLSQSMVSAQTAVEAERVRNTVLASISHDFRTPLASILGSATSLIEYGEKIDAKGRTDLLGHIKDEVEHLDSMVRNLLAMTRIDAGALELRKDWVDLREIVNRVVSAARRRGAVHRIEARLPDTIPLLRADAMLVEQALSNVIGNAIEHTPQETVISIQATPTRTDVALAVEDDGPGIRPEVLPRVFEKFVSTRRLSEVSTNKGEGTGLGLAIAKGIMEAHGGEIIAESPLASGRGTRIVMRFPAIEIAP
jgi:two-component system sensor histidine kinase KdpD